MIVGVAALILMPLPAGAQNRPPDGATAPGPDGVVLVITPPLTEAQKIVQALPPVNQGGMLPLKPLAPDAPLPSSDPHDLRGVWNHTHPIQFRIVGDMFGDPLPYTMAGAKVISRRLLAGRENKPYRNASTTCRPPGQPWALDINFPFQIVQSKGIVEFIFEEYHNRWNIALDPAMALPAGARQYMGRSTGHWEGDTLVVETSGFKQGLWFEGDGTPLSVDGKLIHRIRKVVTDARDPYLEIVTTVIDPLYYAKPWSIVRRYSWQPDQAIFYEYNCEEQLGDPSGGTEASMRVEPRD